MTEIVVERIHEYLSEIGAKVRGGQMKLDDFIIFKRLGKNPEEYPDAKTQPHVQVALRMKGRGGSARAGDVISYVFCVEGGEVPKPEEEGKESVKKEVVVSKLSQAEKAKHPDEIRKAGSGLVVGMSAVRARSTAIDSTQSQTMSSTCHIKFSRLSSAYVNPSRAQTALGWRSASVCPAL
jgi:hypothetical protein